MNIVHTAKQMLNNMNIRRVLKKYLLQEASVRGEPWRDKNALDTTINDVLALDDDLKGYVLGFLNNQNSIETTIGCEVVSITQLVQSGEFNPVTAALFIQWYRQSPKKASAFLLQRDTIIHLPEKKEENSEHNEGILVDTEEAQNTHEKGYAGEKKNSGEANISK